MSILRNSLVAFLLTAAGAAGAKSAVPQFNDYPAKVERTKGAAPILDTAFKRRMQTRLRDGAKEKADFAGHYVIVWWGCGSPCHAGQLVDRRTGVVSDLPDTDDVMPPLEGDDEVTIMDMQYRANSRLLILTNYVGLGCDGTVPKHFYFAWDGGKWRFVKTIEHPGKTWWSEDNLTLVDKSKCGN